MRTHWFTRSRLLLFLQKSNRLRHPQQRKRLLQRRHHLRQVFVGYSLCPCVCVPYFYRALTDSRAPGSCSSCGRATGWGTSGRGSAPCGRDKTWGKCLPVVGCLFVLVYVRTLTHSHTPGSCSSCEWANNPGTSVQLYWSWKKGTACRSTPSKCPGVRLMLYHLLIILLLRRVWCRLSRRVSVKYM